MRRWIGLLAVAVTGLLAASLLGVAGAQETTTTTAPPPPRGISANGAGQRTVPSTASPDAFRAAYHDALTDALADAKDKAFFIAEKSGVTLGAVQSVAETSNTVLDGCNYAVGADSAAGAVPVPSPAPKKKKSTTKKKKKTTAHKAQGDTPDDSYPCPVSASVTARYELTG